MKTQRWALRGAVIFALITASLVVPLSASATTCPAGSNAIVCENLQPGTDPSVWDITGAGDGSIQGFSTDISVNVGSTMYFKVDTDASAYTIDIYRTGYYQGLGARKINTAPVPVTATLPQTQPACLPDSSTEMLDCGNWGVSASWPVPSTAVSGVYFALLTRTDTGGQSHITFVVRNQASTSAVLFQTSDPTWQAYNTYGGSDFYEGAANGRAYKVSYNRPVVTRAANDGRDFYFSAEYPLVRFLEKNGYDVSYFSGVDTDRYGSLLTNHKVFLSVGHDEYWSSAQRANVTSARDAGVNLAFLGGNDVYWRTRYEASTTGGNAYRTLVSYKETWGWGKIDQTSPQWTGTWRDPRYTTTAYGAGLPENALTGTQYMSNFSDLAVTVSAKEGKSRLWRNTSLASLAAGTSATLAAHTIGYESNEDVDNGSRPPGLIRLSTTTGAVPQYLQDFGNNVAAGTTTHHITLYRAPSTALVFSAGSVQWTWGLDQTHDGNGAAADVRMQQAQVNLLADMDAQPTTLASPLVAASKSTDATAPTVTITSPTASASIPNGTTVTATGTASDVGGCVAGVEYSTDAGATWHPATGTTSWSFTYTQHGTGTTALRVRAIDDSGNYPSTPSSVSVSVGSPFSVLGTETPVIADSGDTTPVTLGLRFTPTTNGYVKGVRFYKSSVNTGTHTGVLWDSSGGQLATVNFSGESASGWQTATFAASVAVTAGQSYVVSYNAPAGHYAVDPFYWSYRGSTPAPLQVAGGYGSTSGVYTTTGGFPGTVHIADNYYVDAVFTLINDTPLSATAQFPIAGSTSVPTTAKIGATFSRAVTPSSVVFLVRNPSNVAVGGATASPAPGTLGTTGGTYTFTPSSPLAAATTYTVTLTASTPEGVTLTSGGSWSFTTANPPATVGTCPCSVYDDSAEPAVMSANDGVALSLGMRFATTRNGTVSAVRFYKSQDNTGVHTLKLFASDGTVKGTATTTSESSAGWQTATFATPVAITANTDYIVGYTSTTGTYSLTVNGFNGGFTRGPIVVANDSGTFSYSGAFPSAPSSSSYFVDVVFN
ncbi:N,N-dimethylformamidase beta subunit family domain-containing protein [Glaciihabitans sp. dw_435]|uniref:N,N-dimethylformamidase beta subunit family domain-containing protein n=1 Tax=Glaciihabitans sp. dw_435 TaxID=2720081 RepID=UPI001BD4D82F|nr:N,N-dimethylformamidase beta subunit family domain-containing protein [Glaciihabitans sp. dw_435]